MSGYYQMTRGWQDSDFFGNAEYSQRDAWEWLIQAAAWKPGRVRIKGATIDLERGQLSFSVRFLADKWRWSKSRVDRFLGRLAAESMILRATKIGTTAGHPAGQGQAVITICNYEKYQAPEKQSRDNDEPKIGTTAGQQRDKEEEGNKGIKKEEEEVGASAPSLYAFEGKVIRLKHGDLQQWQRSYPAVEVVAHLQSRDDWLATEADDGTRKRWFQSTSSHLANLQQRAGQRSREPVNEVFQV